MFVEGKDLCEIGSGGLGMAIGAVASGVTGGTLTAPAMLAFGAVGYVLGKILCGIPYVERGFDHLFESGDWSVLEAAVADEKTSSQAVRLIASETYLSELQAIELWKVIASAVKNRNKALLSDQAVREARHHPPTGRSKRGLAMLRPA